MRQNGVLKLRPLPAAARNALRALAARRFWRHLGRLDAGTKNGPFSVSGSARVGAAGHWRERFRGHFSCIFWYLTLMASRRPKKAPNSQNAWPAQCFCSFFDVGRARLRGLPRGLTFFRRGGKPPKRPKTAKTVACAVFSWGFQPLAHGCARQATGESSGGSLLRRKKRQKPWPAQCFRAVFSLLRTVARGRPLARALWRRVRPCHQSPLAYWANITPKMRPKFSLCVWVYEMV